MVFSRQNLFFYALIYAGSFHYVYFTYLADVFDYAYYKYIERELFDYVISYVLCLLPLIFRTKKDCLGRFAFDLMYVLVYVPSQLMLIFMWRLEFSLYYITAVSLFFSIIIVVVIPSFFTRENYFFLENIMPKLIFKYAIYLITILGIAFLFYSYGSTMRIVGFEQVYDLRSEANIQSKGVLVDYLVLWLTFISLPFFFSSAVTEKSLKYLIIGFFISLSLYAAQGAKIAALNSLIVFSLYFLFKIKGDFLAKILFFSIGVFFLITILPDDGFWLWAKSIFMVRVYSNAGWMMVTYSEYFFENGYTYYSHIGILNKIFNAYPYGEYSLGQLIGKAYMGTYDANFNANFLASDGIAAIGPLGMPLISILYAFFISILTYYSRNINPVFLYLFLSGFIMTLLNAPLSTALLSGGGGIILILFAINSSKFKRV